MMFGGNGSLKDTFSETNRIWAGLFGEKTKGYADCFSDWYEDGIFYSDGMIGGSDNPLRTVNLRFHYTNGQVDSVDIAARQGKWDSISIDNLNLNVTNSGYTVNDKDYVLYPEWR